MCRCFSTRVAALFMAGDDEEERRRVRRQRKSKEKKFAGICRIEVDGCGVSIGMRGGCRRQAGMRPGRRKRERRSCEREKIFC